MEVMDITVLEVIADNPPANPEYIELPKSEKFDCKVCGKIQGCPCQFVFGFSVYFHQLSFNDVTFSFRKF
jgi:hypothetical protein